MVIRIYSDGSCFWKTREGGIGIFLQMTQGKQIIRENKYYKGFFNTSIGRMELIGILFSMSLVKNKKVHTEIYCDSQYAINSCKRWNLEEFNLIPDSIKNKDIIKLIVEEKALFNQVHFHWVKGHNLDNGNEIADELAGKGFGDERENKYADHSEHKLGSNFLNNCKLNQIR